jgi:hypothetical protein
MPDRAYRWLRAVERNQLQRRQSSESAAALVQRKRVRSDGGKSMSETREIGNGSPRESGAALDTSMSSSASFNGGCVCSSLPCRRDAEIAEIVPIIRANIAREATLTTDKGMYSNRAALGVHDPARTANALHGIVGRRLTYRDSSL